MSEDLTQKLPKSDSEILLLILRTTQNLEVRFGKLETRVENIDSRVENIDSRVEKIDSRLEGLEEKVEQRLHDTRPIWHKVVADIAELQAGQKRLEDGFRELNSTVRAVNRDQIVINDSLRRIQLDLHSFDERLHRCEMDRRAPNSST